MPKKKRKRKRKTTKSRSTRRANAPAFEIPKVSLDLWREAYDLADEIKELEPWHGYFDTDPLAFTNPQTGEPSFVTLLGNAGEHFAVVVYPDAAAMDQVIEFSTNPKSEFDLLLIPQLHLDFEDKMVIDEDSLKIAKKLGRAYHGPQTWPLFQTFRPGFVPWNMDTDELQLLIHALKLVRDSVPGLSKPMGKFRNLFSLEEEALFIDVDPPEFREIVVPIPQPEPMVMPNPRLVGEMELFQPVDQEIELMFTIMPQQVDDYIRPYYANGLFAVVRGERFVVGFKLLSPIPDYDAVYDKIADAFVQILEPHGIIPSVVNVNDKRVENRLAGLAKAVGFKLKLVDELPDAEEFVQSMFSKNIM